MEKNKTITVDVSLDEERLARIKILLDEIKVSAQEVKQLFKNLF